MFESKTLHTVLANFVFQKLIFLTLRSVSLRVVTLFREYLHKNELLRKTILTCLSGA